MACGQSDGMVRRSAPSTYFALTVDVCGGLVSTVQSFIDTSVLPGQAAEKFYRIQLEPQP